MLGGHKGFNKEETYYVSFAFRFLTCLSASTAPCTISAAAKINELPHVHVSDVLLAWLTKMPGDRNPEETLPTVSAASEGALGQDSTGVELNDFYYPVDSHPVLLIQTA